MFSIGNVNSLHLLEAPINSVTLAPVRVNKFFDLHQVFAKGVDKDSVVLMAARASRLENQDAIDAAIVSMLADPKEVLTQQHIHCFVRKAD